MKKLDEAAQVCALSSSLFVILLERTGISFHSFCIQLQNRSAHIRSFRKIERFIESAKDLPELITEFDESLWAGLVDSMTVYSKDRILFRLTCGMEIEV